MGCGNSALIEGLYKDEYRNITNIDFSETLINELSEKYQEYEELDFVCLDLTSPISTDFIEDGAFEFIIDKGCLDSILCNSNALKQARVYLSNIY